MKSLPAHPASQDGGQEQWEAVQDLDSFFQRVYAYYQERGLRCILASRIISLATQGFTILFALFLFEMCAAATAAAAGAAAAAASSNGSTTTAEHTPVLTPRPCPCVTRRLNWDGLRYDCLDDLSCSNVTFIRPNALHPPSLLTLLYFGPLLTLYWLWSLLNFGLEMRPLLEMRHLFSEKLGVEDADLHAEIYSRDI